MNLTEPVIRVGIMSASKIEFILNGPYINAEGTSYIGKKEVLFRNGMILFEGIQLIELILEPAKEDATFDLIDVVIGINFHWERKENQRFIGKLKFIVEENKITAINIISVEDYLKSVISSEMSATASDELLKAHAVISRSWLLHPIETPVAADQHANCTDTNVTITENDERIVKWYERDAHVNFDVCADDHCQRYQGITRASTQAVNQAIEATRGEVLMYDGNVCDARFSKSCGGVSETFENCWAPVHFPYLTKIIDNPQEPKGFNTNLTYEPNANKWMRNAPEAFCNTNDKKILSQVLNNYDQETTDFYRWKVTYSQEELSELLLRRSGIDFGSIVDMIPVKRGESGRLIELKIVGTSKTVVVGKELEIRKWLSNSHLYSSAFVIEKSGTKNGIPQQFTLIGAGWGHGVGLCQIGAAVMGAKGYNYHDILLHYFSGAELKRIY